VRDAEAVAASAAGNVPEVVHDQHIGGSDLQATVEKRFDGKIRIGWQLIHLVEH